MSFKPQAHRRLQIHAIKTFPASNMNRDDLGAPKEVVFGDARRLRLSSQSIKRSVRMSETFDSFRQHARQVYGGADMIRTRQIVDLIREEMSRLKADDARTEAVVGWVRNLLMGKSIEKKAEDKKKRADKAAREGKTLAEEKDDERTQLIALSEREIRIICEAAAATDGPADVGARIKARLADLGSLGDRKPDERKRALLVGDFSAEAQLFGRMMTAAEGFAGIDSPLQVAHAFTTHAVSVQRDYWTGMDDRRTGDAPEDAEDGEIKRGSGHIDVRKFGAGTFYLYACLDLDLLHSNIQGAFAGLPADEVRSLTRDTALAWLQGMALENPSGYQNSFAAHSMPSAMGVEVGTSFPFSAAKAFERPVESEGGFDRRSVEELVKWDEERRQTYAGYVNPLQGFGLGKASTTESLRELVDQVSKQIDALLADAGPTKKAA